MTTFVRVVAVGFVLVITSGGGTPASAGDAVHPTSGNVLDLPSVCAGQPRDAVSLTPAGGAISLLSAVEDPARS